ncbi:hypothetical protein ABG984_05930 [Collinsella aerofaciens]|uniref:hypothetical protein n=1 Tax=Collinsella aerofaciens TaxID=74426 RepID=UPI00325BDDDD
MKRCNYCDRLLDASEFNRNRANADNRRRASVFGYAQYNRYVSHGRYAECP